LSNCDGKKKERGRKAKKKEKRKSQ
jgi:hypothetical protein